MPTTKNDIRKWLAKAKEKGATHMLVVCDTLSYEDYPVYIMPGENPRTRSSYPGDMQRTMECYSLSKDLEKQLNTRRTWEFD